MAGYSKNRKNLIKKAEEFGLKIVEVKGGYFMPIPNKLYKGYYCKTLTEIESCLRIIEIDKETIE